MKTDIAIGWGIRVGGPYPYLSWDGFGYSADRAKAACSEEYHRPMRVALVPLRELRRLQRLARKSPTHET